VRLGTLVAPFVVLPQFSSQGDNDARDAAVLTISASLLALEAVFDIATVEGAVRSRNATRARPASWRLEPCVTPSAHAPGLALRAGFGGPEGS
jgi:hypothetical protein